MRRVPRLKQWFLSEKKGFLGVFYKGMILAELHMYNIQETVIDMESLQKDRRENILFK